MKSNKEKKTSCSITEVKQSPMAIFNLSQKQEKGIYVSNRNKEVGVMLTVQQYEALTKTGSHQESLQQKLAELETTIKKRIDFGSVISARNLDDQMIQLGFVTQKTEMDNYHSMLHQLNETGKIAYQLKKKENKTSIFAEVIGEQSNQSNLPAKIIVKKIHLKSNKS